MVENSKKKYSCNLGLVKARAFILITIATCIITLVDRLSIISNPMFTPDSKDTSSTQGFCIRIGLETCCIAILENPSSYEVTTPGAVIEVNDTHVHMYCDSCILHVHLYCDSCIIHVHCTVIPV